MDPQYLDIYFVNLIYELEAGRNRHCESIVALERQPRKPRRVVPIISEIAIALRDVPSAVGRMWPLRNAGSRP